MLKLANIRDIWVKLIVSFLAIGSVVGAVGSFFSLRKYLRV